MLKVGPIKDLAQKTNLPPITFAVAPILLMVFAIALDIGASLCTCTIGVAYPTIQSILALESKSSDDDKQWLTYWSIYGLLVVFDQISFITNNIPYYFFVKVCFLIWLFNPATNGATKIYTNGISPLLKKYQPQIAEFGKLVDALFSSNSDKSSAAPEEELKKND